MRAFTRTMWTTAVVAAVVAIGVGTASANRLSYSSTQLRLTATTATFTGTGGLARVVCPVTIEGTLHNRVVAKTVGALVGMITRASVGSCTGGTVSYATETLPWHITYDSFSGTLPRFSEVFVQWIDEIIVRYVVFGSTVLTCRFHPSQGIERRKRYVREAGGKVVMIIVATIRGLPENSFLCEASIEESITWRTTTFGGAEITLTLI